MKYAMRILIVMCCAAALISSVAFAETCSMDKCNMMSGHGKTWSKKGHDKMFFHKARFILSKSSELGLSQDQIQKIKTLEYNLKKSFIKEDADIKSFALDIRQGMMKDDVDINAVNGLIEQKYTVKAQKAKEAIQACVDLKKILTPDQSKKLKEIWSSRMKEKMGHWKMSEGRGWHKAHSESMGKGNE